MTTAKQEVQQTESLNRARNGNSESNYPAIYAEFAARGITDIQPRVNVFTYKAWLKLGRQVRRGEKSVKITSWVPVDDTPEAKCRPRTACVFHFSQTDPKHAA